MNFPMASEKPKTSTPLNVSFSANQYVQSIRDHKYVLDAFKIGQKKAIALENSTPIFLDTNVLLSVYEVSITAREKIKQFVKKHKKRIVITSQVQHEYIKNREKVINAFQTSVTEQIPKNFKTEIVNKFISFKNSNKSKLEDYGEILEKLSKLEETVIDLQKQIEEKVNDKKDIAKTLLLEDDFLELLSNLNTSEAFDKDQLKAIKEEYAILLSAFKTIAGVKKDDEDKSIYRESYSLSVFPGCGEKGDKDDPTGDFIIFNELMQYALDKKTDVIFLTNDTTKGDWLRKDGKVHIHYLENFYLNTGQLIYIINAERLFEDLFQNTSFESLVVKPEPVKTLINKTILANFLNNYEPFESDDEVNVSNNIIDELNLYGIKYLEELQFVLELTKTMIPSIKILSPRLNKIGLFRACFKIYDKNYVSINRDGERNYDNSKYDALRELWNTSQRSLK